MIKYKLCLHVQWVFPELGRVSNMNRLWESDYEVPTWVAVTILVAITGSIAIGFVRGSFSMIVAIWAGIVRLGLSLFLVYLFYRFVVAVETIAEKH